MWQGKSFQYFVVWQASVVSVVTLELWAKPRVKVKDRAAGKTGGGGSEGVSRRGRAKSKRSRQAEFAQNPVSTSRHQEEDDVEKR